MWNDVPYRKEPWRRKDRKPRSGCCNRVANSVIIAGFIASAEVGWRIGQWLA